jgi:hypothetical protein
MGCWPGILCASKRSEMQNVSMRVSEATLSNLQPLPITIILWSQKKSRMFSLWKHARTFVCFEMICPSEPTS